MISEPRVAVPSISCAISSAVESAVRTLDAEVAGLVALSQSLRDDFGLALESAVELIRGARGRLIVTGLGKSGHIGKKIAASFASTGTPSFFVHAAEASHGDLGMVTSDDVIMALSWSGETVELKNLIAHSRRFRIGLIAITSEASSTLGNAADIVLTMPKTREACPHNLAPTTSSLMQLALGDVLMVALLESRGFTALDFGKFHPSGKLGAMLKFVRDLMHRGDAVPIISLGTRMSDALVEMTSKGFGCVGVADRRGEIVGIVTDGDLRRHMRPDLTVATVDEVMTWNPKTISPDLLASEALDILNSSKITALIVTEARKPVGIVHLHDILRAGVS